MRKPKERVRSGLDGLLRQHRRRHLRPVVDKDERQAALDRDAAGLARERYRRGLDTFLTVIDAERTANNSNTLAIDARGETARARIALYRAIGGDGGR